MSDTLQNYLAHYGTPRHSGRYPWGSGGDNAARNRDLLGVISDLKSKGLSDAQIAQGLGMKSTEYRQQKSIAINAQKAARVSQAQRLKDRGWSNTAISQRMFGTKTKESTVRDLLSQSTKDKIDILQATTNRLKDAVAQKKFVDVGTGVELHMGISDDKLKTALRALQNEGYEVHPVQIQQIGTGPGNKTTVKVLAPPGTKYRDVAANTHEIQQIQDFSNDGGRTWFGIQDPLSINSKRVSVRYKEDGGDSADGVIYVRRGVKDVSLGGSHYAQVRVMVDNTHYLKGMAMYKDDLPDGVDLMFNTNKSNTGNKLDSMKALKDDPDNPFGAAFRRQILDDKGKVTSAMNIVNEEGNWETWSKNLSSQFLSKQSPTLARQQLNKTYEEEKAQLDLIMSLTNPTVKQKLLESFADGADAASVDLKAAALPRQASHVILPVSSMKETEIYAPNFTPGERVVLVRYPHGGPFEIPELTVNNRQPEARRLLGVHTPDAVGIHPNVAAKLSGADFDGDSVVIIPQGAGAKIKTASSLAGLKNFDPQREYPPFDGMKTVDGGYYNATTHEVDYRGKTPTNHMQKEMGVVSNLISDMSIKGAPADEMARAVRHSMVVIDSQKHKLNYRQSYLDNTIKELQDKYQAKGDGRSGGASTLLSRRKTEVRIPKRVARGIDPKTGKKIYIDDPKAKPYLDPKTGQVVVPKAPVRLLSITENAHDLSSGMPIEEAYADHSNRMKDLANMARLEAVHTIGLKESSTAKTVYADEVRSLNAKLDIAKRNRPLERQAQILAHAVVDQKIRDTGENDPALLKRMRYQALDEARRRVGAKKELIKFTDNEWAAIQAGAISKSRLRDMLDNADEEHYKRLAIPREQRSISSSKLSQAKTMLGNGYTQAEVAQALGITLGSLKYNVYGGN